MKIIDQSSIEHVINVGGQELLDELIGMFKLMESKVIAAIDAEKSGEFEDVYINVHTLRSGASNLGLEKVLETTAVIEKKLKQNDTETLSADLTELKKNYNEALNHLLKI